MNLWENLAVVAALADGWTVMLQFLAALNDLMVNNVTFHSYRNYSHSLYK